MEMLLDIKISKHELKKKLESLFDKYRLAKYFSFEGRESRITSSYEPREYSPTNVTSDQTAKVASYNVDKQNERKLLVERVEEAVQRLPDRERELLAIRYMGKDSQYLTDQAVYDFKLEEPISVVTYSKIRANAFIKLYGMLQDIID